MAGGAVLIRRRRNANCNEKRAPSCQRKKPSSEQEKTNAKENRPAPRPANSSARKSSTFAKESTARDQQSRPSPSACRKPEGLALIYRRQKKAKPASGRVRVPSGRMPAAMVH